MANLRHGMTLLGLLLAAIAGFAVLGRNNDGSTTSAEPNFAAMVKDYKTWTRVNTKPYRMPAAVMAACAAPTAGQVSPHLKPDGYIDVYVNPEGRSAMFTPGRVVFPVGTIIVKEKRQAADPSYPELLTVMVKRSSGYNPETGDWDFAVLDGKAAAVQAQGKLENCMQCHKTAGTSDYIFRPYLPAQR